MIGFAAHRPAVVWAACIAMLLAGAMALQRLPLATRTAVELPRLQVYASWPGAAPEVIETYLTSPLEAAVQGVRGVRRVSSTSQDDYASLTIALDANADVGMTRLAILERMELLRADLPPGSYAPTVANYVPEGLAEAPLLSLSVNGPYTAGTLQKLLDERISPRLSAVPGVAGVATRGGTDLGVAVSYDAAMLRRVGVTPLQLTQAIAGARIVQSLGFQQRDGAEQGTVRAVVLRDQPHAIADLLALPVDGPGGRVFRLGELATVRAEEDARGRFYRIDGVPAVSLEITRYPGADAIKTAAALRETIESLRGALPPAVTMRIVSDESEALARELHDLAWRGGLAFAAVLVVLVVALRQWRAVALVLGSTLVAMAATALTLYLLHIPANLLTLAGLGMGLGMLVQNGIVVVRRLGAQSDTVHGRASAARAIAPAVLGSTLTTGVVLLPFLYLQGDARAAFMPFAAALSIALAWSLATSLLVVPALADGVVASRVTFKRLERIYARTLARLLRWRGASLTVTVVALSALGWVFWEKVPRSSFGGFGERRTTLSVSLGFPRGSDPVTLDHAMREFESLVTRRNGVESVRTQGYGSTRAGMVVLFTREGAASPLPYELQELLTQRAVLIGGASVSVSGDGPGFSSGGGGGSMSSYRLRVLGYSYEGVGRIADDLKARLGRITRVRDVRITSGGYFFSAEPSQEVTLTPDRAALARYGVTANALAAAVGREVRGAVGRQLLEIDGDELPVTVKAAGASDRTIDELSAALVPNAAGTPVRIGDLAMVSARESPSSVNREDQQYVRHLSYDFRGPAKLAKRTHAAFMKSVSAPAGFSIVDVTDSFGDDEADSARGLWLVFAVGVALVLLAVALVFDSVWGAAMVFLSLPLPFAGVAAAFWLAGATFSREAAVGVLLVMGLAVSHAILLVDAALADRFSRANGGGGVGRNALNAARVMRAARDRAGVILLVTLAGLASLAPMALGTSTGSLSGAIALATVGGTVAGTLGAMFILPLMLVGRRNATAGGRRQP